MKICKIIALSLIALAAFVVVKVIQTSSKIPDEPAS